MLFKYYLVGRMKGIIGGSKAGRWCESTLEVRPALRRETCLVLAIVLLGVAQDPVAESQHVLEVSVALVSQILQP